MLAACGSMATAEGSADAEEESTAIQSGNAEADGTDTYAWSFGDAEAEEESYAEANHSAIADGDGSSAIAFGNSEAEDESMAIANAFPEAEDTAGSPPGPPCLDGDGDAVEIGP